MDRSVGPLAWALFGAIVLIMLVVDLRGAAQSHGPPAPAPEEG